MPGTSRSVRRAVPLVATLLLLAGCASTTPIGDLLSNSSRYNGKTVRIKGDVTKSVGAIVAGAYEVRDNTGSLTVVSEGNSPPPQGVKIGVKGIFQSLLTLGSRSLAVLKEQSRFNP
jgi:outer membrane murein-binding lipoprotein Lpp